MKPEAAANPLLVRRFEQEYTATSRLRHPHIVHGLDFGMDQGLPYLAMEYVNGQSLGQRIKQDGALPLDQVLRIGQQIAAALELAHQHQLIHRDVKPDNILLKRNGHAKLTDLGLIKDLGARMDLTWARTALGTIAYAAPEQFEDASKAGVGCDVYGLATTLYHALTGTAPFEGQLSSVILTQKLRNDFVPPGQRVPSLPRHINEAICRALDAAPERRPGSCAELSAALANESPSGIVVAASDSANYSSASGLMMKERRKACRYPAALSASCYPVRDSEHPWPGRVQDLSCHGMRLELPRRFEPGAILGVDLFDKQAQPLTSVCVRVCWVRQASPKTWGCGCMYGSEMSASDLDALLGNPSKTVVLPPREAESLQR